MPFWTLFRRAKRTDHADEELLSVYRDYGVIRKRDRDDNFNKPSEDLSLYQLVEPGDLAINKMKAWQGSLGISPHRGIVSPAYFVYRALHAESPAYLHYLLRSDSYATGFLTISKGIRINQWDVDPDHLAQLPVPLPPLAEQSAIAAFLDRETVKIDALVAEQRRMIELLREKRQAVISHAVTKGLDPTVPMKDSGVEWLGDVPAHWSVTSVGRLCAQLSYGFTNPMPTSEDGPFMLTANDIGDGQVRFETARRTTREAFDTLLTEKSRPQAGDILLTKDGTLGRIAVFDGTPSCINQSVAFLRPKVDSISSDYLAAALADGVYQDRMIYEAGGTTIKHIYISRLAKMPIAIPPLDEMKQLEEFCLAHRAAAEQLSMAADAAVALLQERRAALISAAVTGKIDVHATAARQAEAA